MNELDMESQSGRDILNFSIDCAAFDEVFIGEMIGSVMIPAQVLNVPHPERVTSTEIDMVIRSLGW